MSDTHPVAPPSGWLRRLQTLSRLGADQVGSVSARRKVVQTNVAGLLGIISCLLYCVAYVASGRLGFVVSGVQLLLYVLPFGHTLRLNQRGRSLAAKWVFFVTAYVVIGSTYLIQGRSIEVHIYFLLFCVVSPMLFERPQWRHTVAHVLLGLVIFGVCAVAPYSPALFFTETVDPHLLGIYRSFVQVALVAALITLVMVSEYSSAGSEMDLQRMAETDVLTGTANRRAFQSAFHRHVQSVREGAADGAGRGTESQPGRLCLLLMDIDHFKRINDEFGHDSGDTVLRRVAELLQGQLRRSDLLARVGGEEFAVLIRDVDEDQATLLAERLCLCISQAEFSLSGQRVPVTLSGGFAFARRGLSESRLYSLADSALYRAKHAGRNRVIRFDGSTSMLAANDDAPGVFN